MTARLPVVGGDTGNWGTVLNAFLQVSHNTDGTISSAGAAGILLSGTLSSRPSPSSGNTGFYYLATDINGGVIYQSTGSGWTQLAAGVTHAANHASGGSDPVSPSSIGAIATSIVTTKGDILAATASGVVARHAAGTNGQVALYDSTQTDGLRSVDLSFISTFFMSNTLTIRVGVSRQYFEAPYTITNVRASVNTVATGAAVICDVKKNGTTIYTTQANRPTIAASTNTTTSNSPDVTSIAAGDYLTVDVAQIGSTIAGADLTVSVTTRRA